MKIALLLSGALFMVMATVSVGEAKESSLHALSKLPTAERQILTAMSAEQLSAVEGGDFTLAEFCAYNGISSANCNLANQTPFTQAAVQASRDTCFALEGFYAGNGNCQGVSLPTGTTTTGGTTQTSNNTVTCTTCKVKIQVKQKIK